MNYKLIENLQYLLSSRNLSILDASKELKISSAALSRYVNGLRYPEMEYIIRIAYYFKVSIDWLVGYDKDSDTGNRVSSFSDRYMMATEDDKAVIDKILEKYGDK